MKLMQIHSMKRLNVQISGLFCVVEILDSKIGLRISTGIPMLLEHIVPIPEKFHSLSFAKLINQL